MSSQAATRKIENMPTSGLGPGVGRGFFKSRERVAENEMDAVVGPLRLFFGDQELRLGAFLGSFVGLERIRAVNEHHHVGVLFDGA